MFYSYCLNYKSSFFLTKRDFNKCVSQKNDVVVDPKAAFYALDSAGAIGPALLWEHVASSLAIKSLPNGELVR